MKPPRTGIRPADLLRLALASLNANLVRSSLTVLGVAIGVFSVVGVMTALSAVRQSIDTSLNVFGANVLQVQRNPAVQLGGPNWSRGRPPVSPREAAHFKSLMDEEGIATTLVAIDTGERFRYGERRTNANKRIVGTNENYLLTHKYDIDYGRNLTAADIEFNRPVCVIGAEIVDELFPSEDPLDKVIVIDDSRYTVIGVLEPRGEVFGQSMDSVALVPINRFVANNWHRWRSIDLAVQAPSPETMSTIEDIAVGNMRLVRELAPEEPNNFEIASNEALLAAFARIAVIVGTVGLGVSAIALVCSGIGIMNIMLVSVTERTREIGIRKSLGARKKNILSQFLLEAIFLSEAGALVGIACGIFTGNLIAIQFGATMIIPWLWMMLAVGVCSAIGIGFGFFPAWRAANLHPVEALRYE